MGQSAEVLSPTVVRAVHYNPFLADYAAAMLNIIRAKKGISVAIPLPFTICSIGRQRRFNPLVCR